MIPVGVDLFRAAKRAIDRGRPVVYAPPIWRALMAVVHERISPDDALQRFLPASK